MSLARLGHSGGGSPSGQETTRGLKEAPATTSDGATTAKPSANTENLPATYGGASGRKNPTRPVGGPARFTDVLTPGGQENP